MKNIKIGKKTISTKEKTKFITNKIQSYQTMISNSIIYVQIYKSMNIFSVSELNICIQTLENSFKELKNLEDILKEKNKDYEGIINQLQKINNDLSVSFRTFGTKNIEDLITVSMGSDFVEKMDIVDKDVYDVIKLYFHPVGYKVMTWREEKEKKNIKVLAKNKIVENFMIVEKAKNMDCFDLARTSDNFQKKVYGIKVAIQNYVEKKTLIVSGIVDDVTITCINSNFIKNKLKTLYKDKPSDPEFNTEEFVRYVNCLTIKEILVYSHNELYQKYIGYINQTQLIKQKSISQNVREFINSELYYQRKIIIQLLIKYNDPEFQYLAYLLYDLLSNDNNGNIDTVEQSVLFDSLPWCIKKYFREAMKLTIKYTKNLSKYEHNSIPMEQQICLLKVNDKVKEKAMVKLKEIKAKTEDSGSKARQYLEGLLKIPFGVFKHEPVLKIMNDMNMNFTKIIDDTKNYLDIPTKNKYNQVEILNYCEIIKKKTLNKITQSLIKKLIESYTKCKRSSLVENICYINIIIKNNNLKYSRLCHSGKKNSYMKENITNFIKHYSKNKKVVPLLVNKYKNISLNTSIETINKSLSLIDEQSDNLKSSIQKVNEVLDKSVYGHKNAKRQVSRIIGQWINGKTTGYCFGFEGPPGVGKTSIAKNGISICLSDEDGNTRPFSFIAIGGSSNGSTLVGHNYTYVGSTWGRIVDILIENKCMNPIIFIDELDKVSRSEHGKEIIGILTHLVDSTQNDSFQDKYFSGVDINLSKALFIFSYNDPSAVDKILLDRIHRIKFSNLDLHEKTVIANKYLLPEINKTLGIDDNIILFDDNILIYIIEHYTYEPGVRKFKEILYEICSEINLKLLSCELKFKEIPYKIDIETVDTFLEERNKIKFKKINKDSKSGVICGLWANSLGKGGIIPIETSFFPSNNLLDLKLTGMQGDVMKESMTVAKTLAWNLSSSKSRKKIQNRNKTNKMFGIHIHCPEGATPKDGPSAGTAITTCLYSLINNKKIKNDVAITGEINLQGSVTAIGGLELKILGGIRAGVKHFLFPEENNEDFEKFMKKYKDKDIIKGIKFNPINNISQALKLAIE